jgi:hypothetical protein
LAEGLPPMRQLMRQQVKRAVFMKEMRSSDASFRAIPGFFRLLPAQFPVQR